MSLIFGFVMRGRQKVYMLYREGPVEDFQLGERWSENYHNNYFKGFSHASPCPKRIRRFFSENALGLPKVVIEAQAFIVACAFHFPKGS